MHGSWDTWMPLIISIPHWCNYKKDVLETLRLVEAISIPHWCNYKLRANGTGLGQILFQFHIGAIISVDVLVELIRQIQFQFHIGAIISNAEANYDGIYNQFQFHIGAIISPACI